MKQTNRASPAEGIRKSSPGSRAGPPGRSKANGSQHPHDPRRPIPFNRTEARRLMSNKQNAPPRTVLDPPSTQQPSIGRSHSNNKKPASKGSREHEKKYFNQLFKAKFSSNHFGSHKHWSPHRKQGFGPPDGRGLRGTKLVNQHINFDLLKNIYTEKLKRKRWDMQKGYFTKNGLPSAGKKKRAQPPDAQYINNLYVKYGSNPRAPGNDYLALEKTFKMSDSCMGLSKGPLRGAENVDRKNLERKLGVKSDKFSKFSNSPNRKFKNYFNSGTMPVLFQKEGKLAVSGSKAGSSRPGQPRESRSKKTRYSNFSKGSQVQKKLYRGSKNVDSAKKVAGSCREIPKINTFSKNKIQKIRNARKKKPVASNYDEYSLLDSISKDNYTLSKELGKGRLLKNGKFSGKRQEPTKLTFGKTGQSGQLLKNQAFSFKNDVKTERPKLNHDGSQMVNRFDFSNKKESKKLNFNQLIFSPKNGKSPDKKMFLTAMRSMDNNSLQKMSTSISKHRKFAKIAKNKNNSHINLAKNDFFNSNRRIKNSKMSIQKILSKDRFNLSTKDLDSKIESQIKSEYNIKPKNVAIKPQTKRNASKRKVSRKKNLKKKEGEKDHFNEYSLKNFLMNKMKSKDNLRKKFSQQGKKNLKKNFSNKQMFWQENNKIAFQFKKTSTGIYESNNISSRNLAKKEKKSRQFKKYKFADFSEDEHPPDNNKGDQKQHSNREISLHRNKMDLKSLLNKSNVLNPDKKSKRTQKKNNSVVKANKSCNKTFTRQRRESARKKKQRVGEIKFKNITELSPILSVTFQQKRKKFDFDAKEKEKKTRKNSRAANSKSKKVGCDPGNPFISSKSKSPPQSQGGSKGLFLNPKSGFQKYRKRTTTTQSKSPQTQTKRSPSASRGSRKTPNKRPPSKSTSQSRKPKVKPHLSKVQKMLRRLESKSRSPPTRGKKAPKRSPSPVSQSSKAKKSQPAPKPVSKAGVKKNNSILKDEASEARRVDLASPGDCLIEKFPEKYLILHSLIGKGSFGEVYLVQNKINQQFYAMKILCKKTLHENDMMRYAMTEKQVMAHIDHPFIVKLRFAFQNKNFLYLFMDYMPGGNLTERIEKGGLPTLTEPRPPLRGRDQGLRLPNPAGHRAPAPEQHHLPGPQARKRGPRPGGQRAADRLRVGQDRRAGRRQGREVLLRVGGLLGAGNAQQKR